jgi:hypothetical protein
MVCTFIPIVRKSVAREIFPSMNWTVLLSDLVICWSYETLHLGLTSYDRINALHWDHRVGELNWVLSSSTGELGRGTPAGVN